MIPWQIRVAAKIVLSRVPVPYRLWSDIGLFRLGQMADPDYAIKIFFLHFDKHFTRKKAKDAVLLEIGPGDSAAAAVCAAAIGAKKIHLLDVGPFASRDMGFYRRVARALRERGLEPPEMPEGMTFEEMLKTCRAEYLTGGMDSLRAIPKDWVDFAWSHSMMEHVRKREFSSTVAGHFHIMKPGGIISHSIDLQDHLGGKLNNLRFPDAVWESDFMANSGFYTNRLRASEIIDFLRQAGFDIIEKRKGYWPDIPTPRSKMVPPFNASSDDDLLARTLAVTVQKPLRDS